MDFIALAAKRYSVRSFSPQPLEEEKLNRILEAGRLAPTGRNYQSQYIYVLSGDSIAKIEPASPCIYGAPVVLVVCYDDRQATSIETNNVHFGYVDTASVITHILLAAAELDIGSCWVGLFDEAMIIEQLDLPANHIPAALVPLGYPAKDGIPSERHQLRKPLSETVKYL